MGSDDLEIRKVKGTFLGDVKRIMADAGDLLPRHMTAERMIKLVYAAATKQPDLLHCTTASIGHCLTTCSELGLEPGDTRGHVYLIPRRNSRAGIVECTLLIGYKGYVELARRSNEIANIDAVVVYEGEPFEVKRGAHPDILHTWVPGVDRSDDKIVAAYAVVSLRSGGIVLEALTRDEINSRHRARSQAWQWAETGDKNRSGGKKDSPWHTDYARMCRKSAIRSLLTGGLVPLSAELVRAIEYDNETDSRVIDVPAVSAAPRLSAVDSLRGLVQGAVEIASETTADAPTHEPNPDLADAIDKMAICDNEREIAGLLKDAADWHPADLAMVEAAAEKRRGALKS